MFINALSSKKALSSVALGLSITALSYSSTVLAQKISGQVVDHQGKAISSAIININGTEQVVTTNEEGFFTLSALTPGKIELHASAKNYTHHHQDISLNQNDISGIIIKLSPSVMEVLDVYATPLHSSTVESALPVNVLSGDALKLKQASTLGETLKNEVGVHSSFYGSVASSPIIRGLDGPRVLISQNGLDAGDASRVGPDHVVSTETSTATQIEVLRGPATLFYGSGAIGGVVNVVDNRVPTSSNSEAEWLLQYNDVSDEKEASFSGQTGTDNIAVHFDAFWRDAGNYTLPSSFEPEGHDEEGHDEEGESDTLANSFSKSSGVTVGASYLFDQGYVGFSYGTTSRDYGIPGHQHHHGEEDANDEGSDEEGTKARMEQDRLQLLSEVNFNESFIKQLVTKLAYTDYQHQEIEDGAIGTTFTNESVELKADFYHQTYNDWQGAWTLHYKNSDFEAIGDEAFAPKSTTTSYALAWLEEKYFGEVLLQLGARLEHVTIDAADTTIGFIDHEHQAAQQTVAFKQQTFTPMSTSIGAVWDYQKGYNLGVSAAYSQRAPSAAELFSFGPHIGAGTFEVGAIFDVSGVEDDISVNIASQDVPEETSYNLDLTWRKFEGDLGFVVSAFYNHVDDYYYQQDTGLFFEDGHEELDEDAVHEDGLPILVYQRDNVDMYGLEAELAYQMSQPLKVTLFGDYIHAELSDGGSLPRIPPMRIGTSVHYQAESFDTELSLNHYFKQSDIGTLETPTSAYSLLDFNLNYYVNSVGNDMVVYVKGQNLTDDLGLVHSSFLKDVAPLPGRNFSIGIRGSF